MNYHYDWKSKRESNAFLALESGDIFRGWSAGAPADRCGEAVFNTGMTGYQEIITDPSYAGQFVVMTSSEIGNYGYSNEDNESRGLFLNGMIVNNLNNASSWRSDSNLSDVLRTGGVPLIVGIDTRALTLVLREHGSMKAYLHCSSESVTPEQGVERAKAWEGLDNRDYAAKVSCTEPYEWDPGDRLTKSWGVADGPLPPADIHIAAFDFGIKWNILRSLRKNGMRVTVFPAKTSAQEILRCKPDGVFLSNGPADPAAVTYAIEAAKQLKGKVPIMGICLGHQILGLACGAERFRLKFGHHGCNHPVKNLLDGTVEITSQNHNFALQNLPSTLELTHLNLNDSTIEGFRHKTEPLFAVQYHPEAAPGPRDPAYLFRQFRSMIGKA